MKKRDFKIKMLEGKKISLFGFFLLFLFFTPNFVFGQNDNFHKFKKSGGQNFYSFDSIKIIPQSILIYDGNKKIIADSLFKFVDSSQSIYFSTPPTDTIEICFRSFPKIFYSPKFIFNKNIIESQPSSIRNPFAINSILDPDNSGNSDLKKSGSISRGISIGNNQDLSVNSNFNLQLDGNLGENIMVKASITDNNIPIQPEGNTQQIQDFDKIYIQLLKNKNALTLGDYELYKPEGYFLNFNKKLTGAKFSSSQIFKDSLIVKSELAYAFARGKYNKLSFNGIDGNQGPYRLTGINGEQVIIVLSGSERVFMDGQLLKRGEEYDYVIDYNSAEIRFTSNKLMTQFSRIMVEYEYSEKNYSRNVLFQSSSIEKNKLKFTFNTYQEGDNKNQPILQSLTFEQKQILKNAGDDITRAYASGADSVSYNANEILYKKIDTLGYLGVFVKSQESANAHYKVSFAFVGKNKGNYIQINSNSNGRVFEFIEPISGISQGEYEPIKLLISPKRNLMLAGILEYKIDPNNYLNLEIATSKNDINLFSTIDKANDQGQGIKFIYTNLNPIKNKKDKKIYFINTINYEFKDKYFKSIERFREAEFERNFNIVNPTSNKYENLINLSSGIKTENKNNLIFNFQNFNQSGYSNGNLFGVKADNEWKKIRVFYSASKLESADPFQKSKFFRQEGELSKRFNFSKIGTSLLSEDNQFKKLSTDSLLGNSYSFFQMTHFISNPELWINKFNLNYTFRDDYRPMSNQLEIMSNSKIYNANYELLQFENSTLRTGGFYREINYVTTGIPNEKNILGKVEYYFSAWEDLINSNTYYEIGSGQEPRREYIYIEVPAGQGVYFYIDYNKNGVKELNEFEPAKFQYEANYIRISIPSNKFIKTNSGNFNESLTIDPFAILESEQFFNKVLRQIAYQINYKKDQKTMEQNSIRIFNPFEKNLIDSHLISLNNFIKHSILFGKNNPGFGLDLSTFTNSNRFILLNGFDTQIKNEKNARLRFLISEYFSFTGEISNGNKEFISEFLKTRNYNIRYSKVNPEISFQNAGKFIGTLSYSYQEQNNGKELGSEINKQNKLGTELRLMAFTDFSMIGKLNFIVNEFIGESNTSVSYEMLEGLQRGKNYTWGLGIQRTFKSNMQLSFNYEGRKSEIGNAIHAGTVTGRAFF